LKHFLLTFLWLSYQILKFALLLFRKLQNSIACISDYRRGLYWLIGFIYIFCYNLSSQSIIALSLIYPLHRSLVCAPFSFSFSYPVVLLGTYSDAHSPISNSLIPLSKSKSMSKSKSKFLYNWRFTANQFFLASRPESLSPNWTLAVLVLT
jgi:hypothetical protein